MKNLLRIGAGAVALAFGSTALAENPGCVLFVDPAGDQSTYDVANDDPSFDILSVGIESQGDNIAFYLEMSTLASLVPNTAWPVKFRDADGNAWVVMMENDQSGTVSFSSFADPEATPAATPVLGERGYGYVVNKKPALPESNYTPEGLITIVVAAADLGGASGDVFQDFITRVRSPMTPAGQGLTPDNAPDDLAPVGTYTVGGSCTKGLAGHVVASESRGQAPFQVHFDASRSTGDGIAAYRFEFGDGTVQVSETPHVSHSYARPGEYTVRARPMNAAGDYGKAGELRLSVSGASMAAGSPGGWLLLALGLTAIRRRSCRRVRFC